MIVLSIDNQPLGVYLYLYKTEPVAPNQFPATYYQGYITEWAETAGAEDSVELSLSTAINGTGVRGNATLTEDQATVVQYEFADTVIAPSAP